MIKTQDEWQRIAQSLITRHDHGAKPRTEEKSNCGACALSGWGERKNGKPYAPNYSGWARVYVQAGLAIPAKYAEAFKRELNSTNEFYSRALHEDIAKYGLEIKK